MALKKKLHQYLWIQENIVNLEDRLLELDTQLQKVTTDLENESVTTTKDPDKWTNLINEKMKVEALVNKELCKGYKEIVSIENIIKALPEREKYLMRLRYIDGFKWEEICVKMNYEWSHIHRIHGDILKKIKNGIEWD